MLRLALSIFFISTAAHAINLWESPLPELSGQPNDSCDDFSGTWEDAKSGERVQILQFGCGQMDVYGIPGNLGTFYFTAEDIRTVKISEISVVFQKKANWAADADFAVLRERVEATYPESSEAYAAKFLEQDTDLYIYSPKPDSLVIHYEINRIITQQDNKVMRANIERSTEFVRK